MWKTTLLTLLNRGFTNNLSKGQLSNVFTNQKALLNHYGGIEKIFTEYDGTPRGGGIDARFLEDVEDIPDPTEHDPNRKNLLILDDIMLGPQSKAEAYYTRGRHNNVDTIYIAQNYFRLPRQTVRENANLIMLFNQDAKNLSHIYQDHRYTI